MGDILARLGAVNPLIWIVMVIALALGFGAKKWVDLMKLPEDKQYKVTVILKLASLALAILLFILVITIY